MTENRPCRCRGLSSSGIANDIAIWSQEQDGQYRIVSVDTSADCQQSETRNVSNKIGTMHIVGDKIDEWPPGRESRAVLDGIHFGLELLDLKAGSALRQALLLYRCSTQMRDVPRDFFAR